MATTVSYKGQTLTTVDNETKTLETKGTWMEDDLTLVDVGGGGGYTIDDIITHEISGDLVYTDATASNFSYMGTKIKTVSLPNITTLLNVNTNNIGYLFANCTELTSFSAPKITRTSDYLLYGCTSLVVLDAKELTDSGTQLARYCSSLRTVVLPKIQVLYSSCFGGCTSLETVDILGGNYIHSGVFGDDTNLTTLIIRKNGVCTLQNINNFNNTPFASNGTGGTLYVPSAQIASYQSANNWSTILGYANNSIQAIEGSIYENQYADGTPIQ